MHSVVVVGNWSVPPALGHTPYTWAYTVHFGVPPTLRPPPECRLRRIVGGTLECRGYGEVQGVRANALLTVVQPNKRSVNSGGRIQAKSETRSDDPNKVAFEEKSEHVHKYYYASFFLIIYQLQ